MIVFATLFFTLVSIVTVLKHTSDELKSRVDNPDFRRVFKSENKKKTSLLSITTMTIYFSYKKYVIPLQPK
jgi:hypothetical protein